MSTEQQKGMSYEEAHAAIPVAKVIKNKAFFDGSYGGERELPMDVQELNPTKLGDLYHEDVVKTLKAQIAELQEHLEDHKVAFDNVQKELRAEKRSKFPEAGWFLPKAVLSDPMIASMEHLVSKAGRAVQVNIAVDPGNVYEVNYVGDWLKYLMEVDGTEGSADQTWVVKLGSAAAHLHEPSLINHVSASKQEKIIKRLMVDLGQPNSTSLAQAFKQFANEICYGHVSLESVVQKVAGKYKGKLRSEAPHANTSSYFQPYEIPLLNPGSNPHVVPEERLVGNAAAAADCAEREVDCARCPLASSIPGCCGGWPKAEGKSIVYSEAALLDPTNLQKATVMGMVGSKEQQEQARGFLMQYLAFTGISSAAVDAYLKQ